MSNDLFASDTKDIKFAEYAISASAVASGMGLGMWLNPLASAAALVGSLALGTAIWAARGERDRDAREHKALRTWQMYADELPDLTSEKRWYFGQGFPLTAEWRRSWDQVVASTPAVRPKDGEPTEGGDPRHYGIGYRSIESIMIQDRTLSVHMGIFGSPGSGKTRFIESVLAGILQYDKNATVILVDPKGDEALRNNVYSICKSANRHFDWVSVANPAVSKSYNCFSRYKDPTELSAKIRPLVPESKGNEFFTDTARSSAMRVAMFFHHMKTFLLAIGGKNNCLPPIYIVSGRAVHLAKAAGRDYPTVDDVREAWANTDINESRPMNMIKPHYQMTPHGWTVRMSAFYPMGVLKPRVPLAHACKSIRPMMWSGRDPNRIEDDELQAKQLAEQNETTYIAPNFLVELRSNHPLDEGFKPETEKDEVEAALWRPLVESAGIERIRKALAELRGSRSEELHETSMQTLEERQKYNASLRTGVDSFMGRDAIVDAAESDVDLDVTVASRGVAYFEMDILRNPTQAEAIGKMVIADISAMAGAINASDIPTEQRSPIYLIIDEFNSCANRAVAILMSQSRAANIRVVYLAQDRAGLAEQVGKDVAQQILNNTGTLVQLRCREREESEAAVKFARQIQVLKAGKSIGITPGIGDSGHKDINLYSANEGHSWSEEKADIIPSDMLLTLPFGHACVVSDGHPMLLVAPQITVRPEQRRELLMDLGISSKIPTPEPQPVEGL